MTSDMQRVALTDISETGDAHMYLETYVPFDGKRYHEWIVEVLPDQMFRLWRQQGFPESGVVSYTVR